MAAARDSRIEVLRGRKGAGMCKTAEHPETDGKKCHLIPDLATQLASIWKNVPPES